MFIFRGPSVPNMWLRHYVSIGIGQIQEQAKIEQPPSLDQLPFALWCLCLSSAFQRISSAALLLHSYGMRKP